MLHAGARLGLHASVRHSQFGGGSDRGDEWGIVHRGGVVHQHGDSLVPLVDRGDHSVRPEIGELDRPPTIVHVPAKVGHPVADHHGRIAERSGELVAQRSETAALAEADHKVRHGRRRPPTGQRIDEEHDGDRRHDGVVADHHHRAVEVPPGEPLHRHGRKHRRIGERRGERRHASRARRSGRPGEHVDGRQRNQHRDDDGEHVVAGDRDDHRADVDEGDRRDLQPPMQPTGGIREMNVDERTPMPEQGERCDRAGEPGQAGEDHQRPRTARPAVVPRDDTAHDQHHADHAVGNEQLDVADLVRAPFRRDREQQPRDNDRPAE